MLGLYPALIIVVSVSRMPVTCTGKAVACFPNRPCKIPFVTRNPATLICPNGPAQARTVSWIYFNSSDPGSRAVPLVGEGVESAAEHSLNDLQSRSELRSTNLLIRSPSLYDSGLYICKVADKTLAYYEADIQDIDTVHLSGKSIGVSALPNRNLELGRRHLEMFTLWNAWEDCDRCDLPGERRRLGFCYARLRDVDEMAVPCGLMVFEEGQSLPRRGPELSLEPCYVPCSTDSAYGSEVHRHELPGRHFMWLNDPRVLLFETYLVNINDNVTFRCPEASIYTPVSWQRNSSVVTRLKLSKDLSSTHSLDEATGGSAYSIRKVQMADEGVYKCFVYEKLAASFHLRVYDPFRQHKAVAGSALGLIWYTLGSIAVVSVLLLLLTFLYAYCSQTRRRHIMQW
ncbi:protein FAM187B-like [Heptranchias perlo]|uniref:protein FAM187B-like n=1 Tax=Heptranchias perlo TaxID=212740 RepID=UPI0035597071